MMYNILHHRSLVFLNILTHQDILDQGHRNYRVTPNAESNVLSIISKRFRNNLVSNYQLLNSVMNIK